MHCSNCWYVGDLIGVYAQARELGLLEAVLELQSLSLLDLEGQSPTVYVANAEQQGNVRRMLVDKRNQAASGLSGASLAILDHYNCRFPDTVTRELVPHAVPFHRDDLDSYGISTPKIAKQALKWLGKYLAWAIPCWQDADVVGLWLITARGFMFLPLVNASTYALGLASRATPDKTRVVALESPVEALRYTLWSIHNSAAMTFVVPHGINDGFAKLQIRPVFWSTENNTGWLVRALRTSDAQSVDTFHGMQSVVPGKLYPCKGDYRTFSEAFEAAIGPAHRVLAQQLLALPVSEARSRLVGVSLDSTDHARLLANATGDASTRLQSILQVAVQQRKVLLDSHVIVETPNGWMWNNKIVSSAMFYMDEIRPIGATGDASVNGTIVYAGNSYAYRELLSVIKKNPGAWIERFLVAKAGRIPQILPNWSSRLLDISQRFKEPTPIMSSSKANWSDGVLTMPLFQVDRNGVYPYVSSVEGPNIPYPSPMTSLDAEQNRTIAFWRLWLAISGNLIRTARGRRGLGIMLVDSERLMPRIAEALGSPIIINPTVDQMLHGREAVLPMMTAWSADQLQRAFEQRSEQNIVVNVDFKTAMLARTYNDWLVIDSPDGILGSTLKVACLPALFACLPALLRAELDVDSREFYRSMAKIIAAETGFQKRDNSRTVMDLAAGELEYGRDNHGLHVRLMLYLSTAHDAGWLTATESPEGVTIRLDDLQKVMSGAGIKPPPLGTVCDALASGRFATRRTPQELTISTQVWGFYCSSSKVLKQLDPLPEDTPPAGNTPGSLPTPPTGVP